MLKYTPLELTKDPTEAEDKCDKHVIWHLLTIGIKALPEVIKRKGNLSNLVVALNNAMEQWSYSNCYFNCNVVKSSTLTIAGVDQ